MSTDDAHDTIIHDIVVEAVAHRLAEQTGQHVDSFRPGLRQGIVENHRQYRRAGAPYYDTAAGLTRWIMELRS